MYNHINKHSIKPILVLIFLLFSGSLIIITSESDPPYVSGLSTWENTNDNDFNNGTLTNLSIIGSGSSAKLKINMLELNDWNQKFTNDDPGGTSNHRMAPIYNTNKVLLFGGYDGWTKQETWIYREKNNTWTQQYPANKPSDRYGHAMAEFYGTDKVLLFGGYDGLRDQETWIYDLSENDWVQQYPVTKPSARYDHVMVTVHGTDKVVLFGGNDGYYNDETWIYDLSEGTWTIQSPSSEPDERVDHAMASIYGTDKVLLFGGYRSGKYDDTWVYDLSSDTWTRKYPTNKPSVKEEHEIAAIHGTDKILLAGGIDNSNETWIYDLSDNNWLKISVDTEPSRRYSFGMASIYNTDKIAMFGGYWGGYKNDTWVYKHFLNQINGSYVSEKFDTGANSTFETIIWNGMIPDETIIKFQLKTAKTSSELNNKDFIGPEGTTKSYYTNTNEPIWDGHNGDRWLQFKINLNISILTESPTLNDVNITYNCIPETRIVVPTNGTIITINKPVFKWEFLDVDSDSQAAFQVQIDNESTFDEVDYDSLEQSTSVTQWQFPSGTSFSSLPEGTWYWKVRTKDYDDRWSDYTSPSVLIIDSSPPITAITFPINNGFFNGAGNINGIALDGLDGSGVSKTEIAIKRLSDNYYWNVYNWFPLETWLMVTGTTEWSYSSEQISWTNNDQYTIQSRAIDKINNMETPTKGNTITIDLIAPKTTINTPINNTWTNNIESIIGESDDYEGSGIDEISITIKSIDSNRYWNGLGWDNQKNSINIKLDEDNSWSFDTSAIQWGCGYYLASVQALDNANNTELPVARNFFMFDDVLPIPTSISINDGAIYTNNSQVIFSLFAEDLHSGVHQMSFNVDNIGWSEWESFSTLQKYNLTTSDGLKEVYFRVKDHAGNIGGNIYDAIILDATPPEQLSMMINNDAGFANSEIVSVELSAVDFISGIKDMAFSTNGNDWSPWELFNPTKHINLPDGDGEKILYFKIRDNANNIAETSKSIIIDKTPPHSLTVQINNGSSETNTNLVKLSLNSIDNLSGVDKFSLSIDGNRWSSWENFTKETSFTFTEAEGTKTIYFKVKDHAGNIAEPVSTTITYKIAEVPQEQEGTKKFIGQNIWLLFLLIIIIIVILFITLALIIKRAPKPKYDYTTQPKPVEKPSGYYHGSQRPRMPGSGSETTIITPDRYKTMDARDQYTNVVSTPTISTIPQTTTTTAPTDAVSVSLLEKQAGSQQTREKPNKTFNEGAATTTISDSVPGPEPKLFDTPQLPPGSDQTTPTITPAVATTPTPTPKVRSTQMEPDLISSLDELDDDSWMETSTNSSAPSTSEVSIPKTELDEIEDIQIPESETSEENVIENQSTQVDEIELQTQATYKPGITPDKITKKKHDDFDYDEEWRDQ